MTTHKKPTTKIRSTVSKKSPAKASTVSSKKRNVTVDDIRARAEKIYNERVAKGIYGSPESDWLQAEKELKSL
jgi:hypothetical protein